MRLLNKCDWEYIKPINGYGINAYKGCAHNCCWNGVLCWSATMKKRFNQSWDPVPKPDFKEQLMRELQRMKPGYVVVSNAVDGWQPIEEELKLTRFAVKELLKHKWKVIVLTKSSLVERDFDIFNKDVWLGMTLTSPVWADKYEKASWYWERCTTLENAQYGGCTFKTWMSIEPFDPDISLSTIEYAINLSNPSFVVFGSLNMSGGRPKYDYSGVVPKLYELTQSFDIPFFFKSEFLKQVPEKLRSEIQAENKVPWRKK